MEPKRVELTYDNNIKTTFLDKCVLFENGELIINNKIFEYLNILSVDFYGKNECKNMFTYMVISKNQILFKIENTDILTTFCVSIDLDFLIFSDINYIKILNLKSGLIKLIKNISNILFIKTISKTYFIFGTKNNIWLFNLKNKNCIDLKFYNFSEKEIGDIYSRGKNIFKIGLTDGSIVYWKNNIYSYKRKSLLFYQTYFDAKFSSDGKILILSDYYCKIQFIHENATIEDDNICFIKDVNNCFCASKDSKTIITAFINDIKIYDISCIGNLKRMQCFEFISGMYEKRESVLSVFFKHRLFDINVVKIIFSFLPCSTVDFKAIEQ